MSAICRAILRGLFIAVGCTSLPAFTEELAVLNLTENDVICNSSGECSIDISWTRSRLLLACETPAASINWNRNEKNTLLVACDCKCSSHDNIGWLVSAPSEGGVRNIKKIELGKKISIEALGYLSSWVPDLFSSYELCEKVDPQQLRKSIFVSLLKQPATDEGKPYCFSPMYIVYDAGRLYGRRGSSAIQTDKPSDAVEEDLVLKAEIIRYVDEITQIQ